jgi:sugar-specific transcriptional regulator TrmB
MIAELTEAGYRQTREKLANLERRLAEIESRSDLAPLHRDRVSQSYRDMIAQYKREILLYEEKHPTDRDATSTQS